MSAFSIFLAGDAMIVAPWSGMTEPACGALFRAMRAADATIVNLETVIRDGEGYPQADSGGSWMASAPEIADELAWAGVNMVSHANNHAFDYGPDGILKTIERVNAAGIEIAGSGPDLQTARSPRYFRAKGRLVGLVSMAATFIPYGRAGRSRPDHIGRPGVNPLRIIDHTAYTVTPRVARLMAAIDRLLGRDVSRYDWPRFRRFGKPFTVADRVSRSSGRRPCPIDAEANLAAVAEARKVSDHVVVALHSHDQSPWLRIFAHRAIRAGADAVHVHGQHRILPIEMVEGRPVFYGLGNFVYQAGHVGAQPADAYEQVGLGDDATPQDICRNSPVLSALAESPSSFQGLAATLSFNGTELAEVQLIPLDLRQGRTDLPGTPAVADSATGHRLIDRVARLSRKLGCDIRYDAARNLGVIAPTKSPGEPPSTRAASQALAGTQSTD